MKIKTIAAILLGAATLAAAPALPVTRGIWQDNTIVADAADSIDGYAVVDQVMYALYRASNNVLHAEAITCYESASSFSIPAVVSNNGNTYPVTKIANGAFSNRTKLTKVNCSSATNLNTVGENAFYCSTVKTVTFGSSVKILQNAFCGCNNISTVNFNSSSANVTINQNAFMCANGLQTVNFSCKSVTINSNAFSQCRALSSVIFNGGVQSVWIGSHGLSDLMSLSTVRFDNANVKLTLYSYAFANTRLTTITLPKSVTSIPAYCFYHCQHLTSFKIPSTITSINNYAFKDAALSSTFTIPANVTTIADSAFSNLHGVETFEVVSGNTKFKVSAGGLYTADLSRLICYAPEYKPSNSFVVIPAKTIPDGTIANNPYIQSLNIQYYTRRSSDKSEFPGLTALTSIILPSSEYNKTGKDIMTRFDSLFSSNSKLIEVNGNRIVQTPYGKEPCFLSKFASYLTDTFDTYEDRQCEFMTSYIDTMTTYVVNKYTTSSMTPVQKAVRLQKWIVDRVLYDPDVAEYDRIKEAGGTPDESLNSHKNHVDSSVYLHKKSDGKYYTVCDGYARCFKLLMDKAGVEAYYVSGPNEKNSNLSGHAWNLIKFNGNYFHVDTCWDDNTDAASRFANFMCSDSQFNYSTNGHSKFNWEAKDDPTGKLKKGNNVAKYAMSSLGNLKPTSIDKSFVTYLKTLVGRTDLSAEELLKADLNFNGKVDNGDVTLLQNYINSKSKLQLNVWLFQNLEK